MPNISKITVDGVTYDVIDRTKPMEKGSGVNSARQKNSEALGDDSAALGLGIMAKEDGQLAAGRFNADDADALLIVGNGESDENRSNAFTVKKDGRATVGADAVNPEDIPSFGQIEQGYVKKHHNGDIEVEGSLLVKGTIIQIGENYETHAEEVHTKDDAIMLREGAVSRLPDGQLAGVVAQFYDGESNGVLGFDSNGTARVGDEGDTQALATRAEERELADGQVMTWNATARKLVGSSSYVKKYSRISGSSTGVNIAMAISNNYSYNYAANSSGIESIYLQAPSVIPNDFAAEIHLITGSTVTLTTPDIKFKGRDCLADGTFDIQPNTRYYINFMAFAGEIIGIVATM